MIQIIGIILIIGGILIAASPAKMSVEPQNKKQIAKGQAPMSEEEFALAIKKARKSGILIAVAGVVMAVAVMLPYIFASYIQG
ncbi:MAG: hypothetical protein FWE19_02250 [Oscillospiraceae bacterium]|nr:hypothetical protein [Oscillospiraceae bacterium]